MVSLSMFLHFTNEVLVFFSVFIKNIVVADKLQTSDTVVLYGTICRASTAG